LNLIIIIYSPLCLDIMELAPSGEGVKWMAAKVRLKTFPAAIASQHRRPTLYLPHTRVYMYIYWFS